MLRLSKKADYALIAMRHLASGEAGSSASAREMAESYAIPPELLAKVLQRLVRAGLTVADVIQAIDGPVAVTACSPDDHACEQYERCEIRDPLWRIKSRIVDALATVSLAELAEPVAPASISAPLVMHTSQRAPAAAGK